MPVVPEGHQVTITCASPFPDFLTGPGLARVVHLGLRGDEQRAEVEQLFERVRRDLETSAGSVLLSTDARRLSDLFAPGDPQVQRYSTLVVWTGRRGCFGELVESAAGIQRLLRLFFSITNGKQPRSQVLYLTDTDWPNSQAVIARLKGLGVSVRKPDADGTLLIEVHRPEGVVLTALAGETLQIEADPRTLAFYHEKDEASKRGDTAALFELERRERAELEENLVFDAPSEETGFCIPGKPVLRCGRLRTLVLDAIDHSSTQPVQLARALLANPYPLLALTDATGRHFLPMQWDDGTTAIPLYTDLVSLEQHAQTSKLSDVGYGAAALNITQFCQLALQANAKLVINAYTSAVQARYLLLTPVTMHALAAGRAPTLEEFERETSTD